MITCTHPATVTVTTYGDEEDDRVVVPANVTAYASQTWYDRWDVTVRCDDCGTVPTVTATEDHPESDDGDPECTYWQGAILTVDWATEGARRVSLRL